MRTTVRFLGNTIPFSADFSTNKALVYRAISTALTLQTTEFPVVSLGYE